MHLTRSTNRLERLSTATSCTLRIVHGPDAGLEAEIPAVGVVVGGASSADVAVTDPAVSGRHCSIVPRQHGFEVSDLKSKNGTYLDGVALTRATVPVGSILRVGTSLLHLVPAEEVLELPVSQSTSFGKMVGSSIVMRQVFGLLERASQSNASVLLIGESGTGKELAARAVHDSSSRKNKPFMVFDCGAASENLIESDLFGHVRGAFTGAHIDRQGAFELAHEGTLFLDEIGDLPLSLQPKLLRMLEMGEVMPLGGRRPQRFDVRVVAATNRDLIQEVARGTFRGDLYYRLAVIEVHLPPLRQRIQDVEDLVRMFLKREGRPDSDIACSNLEKLKSYGFPGNVRELRNVIGRAVALSAPGARLSEMPILLGALAAPRPAEGSAKADRPFHEAKADVIARFEREYLSDLVSRSQGNISLAARMAGVERKHLYRLLHRAGLGPKPDDEGTDGRAEDTNV